MASERAQLAALKARLEAFALEIGRILEGAGNDGSCVRCPDETILSFFFLLIISLTHVLFYIQMQRLVSTPTNFWRNWSSAFAL